MLILFDHSTPAPLRYALKRHVVVEAVERGWDRLVNGDLLNEAENAGFDPSLTLRLVLLFQTSSPKPSPPAPLSRRCKLAVFVMPSLCRAYGVSQGLTTAAPRPTKSCTFRVTMASLW